MGGIPILDLPFEDVADVASRAPRGPDTPERRLARALLTDALLDLQSAETRAWIADDVDEYPGHWALPFNWVAAQVRVPAAALRARLLVLADDPHVRFRRRRRGMEMVEALVQALGDARRRDVATG